MIYFLEPYVIFFKQKFIFTLFVPVLILREFSGEKSDAWREEK